MRLPAIARVIWLRWTAIVGLAFASLAIGRAAEPEPGPIILPDLKSFNTVATLLHVAAHPDDENTQLITYFAKARGYRTAYLSVTRGDGGQNEIGPEFGERLGLARTQELLAARKIDGGRQFFTRALDFGYSKSLSETLAIWDRQQVTADIVRVIRTFRPDVVITRFQPQSQPETMATTMRRQYWRSKPSNWLATPRLSPNNLPTDWRRGSRPAFS